MSLPFLRYLECCFDLALAGLAASEVSGSVVDHVPIVVRIEAVDEGHDLRGARSEVPFMDYALLVDDKGLRAGFGICDRPGDQSVAGDHVAVDDVVVPTAGYVVRLRGQDAEA